MSKQKLRRPCRLGVNAFDLQELAPSIWAPIAKDRIALSKDLFEIVDKNRKDEICAVFICPILEAALAIDKLLSERRAMNELTQSKEVVRCYINRGLNWVKLNANSIMTLYDEENETYVLNPDIFPLADAPVDPKDIVSPPIKRFF